MINGVDIFLMSIKIPIVYLPSSMDLVIFSTSSKSANDVDQLDLNPYWLSLNSICLSIYVFYLLLNKSSKNFVK